ncbi:Hypothetical predicted protein [Cloeon dipterum]|uniref:Uncharacterized protein n=1 Tax=Cloeon dipterum TaxID=197152 RepID=A0A8S1DD06_9INSE|nr:Hypothetical predicted protein [Cloeon dipterum]
MDISGYFDQALSFFSDWKVKLIQYYDYAILVVLFLLIFFCLHCCCWVYKLIKCLIKLIFCMFGWCEKIVCACAAEPDYEYHHPDCEHQQPPPDPENADSDEDNQIEETEL